ncbi:hypothetical protein POM88_002678 [Heracleum sosnowskyi]|uniref:Uncharacterized protein n=1 Tax=Heracleum sosnowskyi TaxID=360622 RepID=A0AAD8JFZ7_9APIA|nr:hypothetical protein POM88_002678 [Heracleum sosnowskyi]
MERCSISLTLPKNMNDILATLVNLQNLTLSLSRLSVMQAEFFISCPPQLLNLTIRISTSYSFLPCFNIVVLAPKLCNFTSFGIFTATLEVPELENVNIRVHGWFQSIKCNNMKLYYPWLTSMLLGLGNAKNLTFDLESFERLEALLESVSDLACYIFGNSIYRHSMKFPPFLKVYLLRSVT